jgi:hypothetical protein
MGPCKETTIERIYREVNGRKMPLSVRRILLRQVAITRPRINDSVTVEGYTSRFTVTRVDTKSETADLQSAPVSGGSTYTLASITWKAISYFDASS